MPTAVIAIRRTRVGRRAALVVVGLGVAVPALLVSSAGHSWWWRVPAWVASCALVVAGLRSLYSVLARRQVELDFTTLTIRDRTRFGPTPKVVSRRDVLGVEPGSNVGLRLRRVEAVLDLDVREPQAAARQILDWIGKGPAGRDARDLVLTRLAGDLGALAVARRPAVVADRPSLDLAARVVAARDLRRRLLARLAVDLNSLALARSAPITRPPAVLVQPAAVEAGLRPLAADARPVPPAVEARPVPPAVGARPLPLAADARRLALTRVAVALLAGLRSGRFRSSP